MRNQQYSNSNVAKLGATCRNESGDAQNFNKKRRFEFAFFMMQIQSALDLVKVPPSLGGRV